MQPEAITPADLPVDLGRYTLEAVLGEGGMARVFRATLHGPAGFTKPVALKVVRSDRLDAEHRAGLVREARIGGLLNHPNVVNTYDLGEIGGSMVVAMELVEGVSVAELQRKVGRLEPGTVLSIAAQAAAGLAHAHELTAGGRALRLVHRDLKPANLLVSGDGVVKVADFGIALAHGIAEGRDVVGTPPYMSPEQVRGEPLDPRSDLFAMGAVITALALGRSPFARSPAAACLAAILEVGRTLQKEKTLAQLDAAVPGLGPIVADCLAPAPADRPASARDLQRRLEALAAQTPRGPDLGALVRGLGPERVSLPAAPTIGQTTMQVLVGTNLAPAADRFVGRQAERAALGERFAAHRLVTLTGAGGAGKSRLARTWALEQLPALADRGGVWAVELSGVRGRRGLLLAVLEALQVLPESDEVEAVAAQAARVLAARGPTLLLLDAFDALVGHADTVVDWLAAAPELKVLVTSRERLRAAGESVLVLDPLPVDDAVALFVARAEERAPGRVGEGERARVRELVERLEGVPLALELAAAQLEHTGLARLARRPTEDGLRAVIDWSWALLTPPERDALGQLSVFVDGFAIEDAEAVLDLSAHLDAPWGVLVVESLVDKSLVRTVPVPGLRKVHRLVMSESVRRYAAEKLRSAGAVATTHGAPVSGPEALRRAEARHAACFARRGAPEVLDALDTRGGATRWALLRLELGNLEAAVPRALAAGRPHDAARAALAAARVMDRTGALTPGLQVLEQVLDAGLPDADLLALRLQQGHLLRRRGQLDAAVKVLERAGRMAGSLGEAAARVDALIQLGSVRLEQGLLDQARPYLERALHHLAKVDDPRRTGLAGWMSARVTLQSGDLGAALGQAREAVRSLEQAGDTADAAAARLTVAEVLHRRGDTEGALLVLDEALAAFRRLGDRRREGVVLTTVGDVNADLGRPLPAMEAYDRALALQRRTGDRTSEGATLMNLAVLHQEQGDVERARALYAQALALHRELGARLLEAVTLGNLGELDLGEERLTEAAPRLDQAVALLGELGASGLQGFFLAIRAHLRALLGDLPGATRDAAQAEAQLRAGGDRLDLAKVLCRRGQVDLRAGRRPEASAALREAEAIAEDLGAGEASDLGALIADLREALGPEAW